MGKTADIAYDTLPAAHQLHPAQLAVPLHHGGKVFSGSIEVLGAVGGDDGVGDLFVHVFAAADDGGVGLFAGVGVHEALSFGFFGPVEKGLCVAVSALFLLQRNAVRGGKATYT